MRTDEELSNMVAFHLAGRKTAEELFDELDGDEELQRLLDIMEEAVYT